MRDVIDRIIAGHILLLQEIGGVAFPFGKERDQNIGACNFFAARGLDMDDRALDDALEAGGRFGIDRNGRHETQQFRVDIVGKAMAEDVEVDPASTHHSNRIAVIGETQKQMLKRRIFMLTLIRKCQCLVKNLL